MSIFAPPALADAPPRPEHVYEVPAQRKSAGLAWLLSLFVPGAGQIYLGARTRGIAMLAATGLAIALPFLAIGYRFISIRVVAAVAAFASIDAYFTARERNRGIDVEAEANPRIAALLNLTTSGFGYVYLGIRVGLLMFAGYFIVGRVVFLRWPLLAELIMIAVAAHAFILAKQRRDAVYTPGAAPVDENSRVPAAVPVIISAILYLTLVRLTL